MKEMKEMTQRITNTRKARMPDDSLSISAGIGTAVSWTSQKGFVNAIAAHAVMHLKRNSSKTKTSRDTKKPFLRSQSRIARQNSRRDRRGRYDGAKLRTSCGVARDGERVASFFKQMTDRDVECIARAEQHGVWATHRFGRYRT